MELGTPPLYSVANRAARDMDMSLLEDLGPFNQALCNITYGAEHYKDEDD